MKGCMKLDENKLRKKRIYYREILNILKLKQTEGKKLKKSLPLKKNKQEKNCLSQNKKMT